MSDGVNTTESGDYGEIDADKAAKFSEPEQNNWDLPAHASKKFENKNE